MAINFPNSPSAGTEHEGFTWDGSAWVSSPASVTSGLPAGTIVGWGSNMAPANWLICDGSAVSRSAYASLFAAIGTTYGSGDGSTTFNLPNFKGRVLVGRDSAQTEFDALGESGGVKAHTLSISEMPSHSHGGNTAQGYGWPYSSAIFTESSTGGSLFQPITWRGSMVGSDSTYQQRTLHTHGINAEGGGQAHNNLQPYQIVNYIIKFSAGVTAGDSELAARVGALESDAASSNKSGLVPMTPSSIGIGSGTYSVSADGATNFSGASVIRFNGVFKSSYSFYKVVASISTPTYQAVSLISRWSTNGVDDTSGYYYEQHYQNLSNTHTVGVGSNQAQSYIASIGTMACQFSMDIANPMQAYKTSFLTNYLYNGVNAFEVGTYGGFRESITSNDGFSLYLPSGTISGKLQVFAYRG